MKNSISIFIFLIFSLHTNAQWTSLGTGITASPRAVWGMSIPDSSTIWAMTWNDGTFTPTKNFTISTDGGQTWTPKVATGIPTSQYFNLVFAQDAERAWITTSNISNPLAGSVYRTIDGGDTWNIQSTAFSESLEAPNIIHFFDENNGITVGTSYGDSNYARISVYITLDGGDLWFKVGQNNFPPLESDEEISIYHSTGLYDVVGNTIWVTSTSGKVFKSEDKGITWTVSEPDNLPNVSEFIPSIAMKDELNGILTYSNGNIGFRTTDGGLTWEEIDLPSQSAASVGMIDYVPGTEGTYMIQPHYAHNDTRTLLTLNDGEDWEVIETPEKVTTLRFLSPSLSFGGGRILGPDNGGVYKWEGENLISSIRKVVKDSDSQVSVFPNPTNHVLNLEYAKQTNVQAVEIKDCMGKTVYSKNDLLGSSPSSINIEDLPIGLYYLHIASKEEVVVKSFVKSSLN